MKLRRIFLTFALTGALGFGVWSLAVGFATFGFQDGDTLSALELNEMLNDNFDLADDAINGLQTDVASLESDVAGLEGAVSSLESSKFDSAGGSISGRTAISGPASTSSTGTSSNLLYVNNTNTDEGSAAVFQSANSSNSGAVSIKQQGAGPALSLKSNGGGPLISGAGELAPTFIVEHTGTIMIGSGISANNPALTLDAETGTITNNVGSGLPLAFGYVSASGEKVSGTGNFTVTPDATGVYRISLTGEEYSRNGFATMVQHTSPVSRMSRASDNNGDLMVYTYSSAGNASGAAFHFVVYKDGN